MYKKKICFLLILKKNKLIYETLNTQIKIHKSLKKLIIKVVEFLFYKKAHIFLINFFIV